MKPEMKYKLTNGDHLLGHNQSISAQKLAVRVGHKSETKRVDFQ